eukprot:s4468_g3.t1
MFEVRPLGGGSLPTLPLSHLLWQVLPIEEAEEEPSAMQCRKKHHRKRGRAKMGWVSSKSSRRVANKGTLH